MFNRKSLLFALCAVASIAGFYGCSDDGASTSDPSDETLAVNPESVTLDNKGDKESVSVTHSAASITSTPQDETCVKATVEKKSDGKSDVVIQAVSDEQCATTVEIKGDEKTVSVAADVTLGKPFLLVTPANIEAKVGDSKRATAEYAEGSKLTLTVVPDSCVTLESNEVTTNSQGKAFIDIKAGDSACIASLTVTPADGKASAQTIAIKVTEDGGDPGDDGKGVLEFFEPNQSSETELNITLNGNNPSENFGVRYYYSGTNKVVADHKILFTVGGDDDDCIKVTKGKTIYTDEAGVARNGVTFITKGVDGCDATVSISTEDADVNKLSLKVHVDAIEDYRMNVVLNTNVKNENLASKIGYVRSGFFRGLSCEKLSDYTNWGNKIDTDLDDNYDDSTKIDPSGQPLAVLNFNAVPVLNEGEEGAVVAYATSGDQSTDVIAYGCHDIEGRLEGEVAIDLTAVPVNVIGEYEVISNFDISSAFTRDQHDELPVVEDMNAGDWIDWIVQMFGDPAKSLYDFIWVNSIARLGDISGIPDWLAGFIKEPTTRDLVWDAFKGELLKYLGEQNWYVTITKIAPDIKDLTTNMQLAGTMVIEEVATDEDGLKITKASQTYDKLQYRWSYNQETSTGCLPSDSVFADPKSCRKEMKLDNKAFGATTLAGNWTGNVVNGESANTLGVDQHGLEMQWALILYNAIFGEILPNVLGYDASDNVTKERLLSAFLDKVLFESIANVYMEGREAYNNANGCKCSIENGKEICKGEKCRYSLQSVHPCQRFVEAIVYYAYSDAAKYVTAISSAANIACSDSGLGKLDKLVVDSLKKVQSGTFTIATDPKRSCVLYDDGTSSYQRIGDPSEEIKTGVYSVYDVVKEKINTRRCQWNFDLTENYTAVGLFHAKRTK